MSEVSRGSRIAFWILSACWLAATVILFKGAYDVQYQFTNTDGISYMRIAENYLAGRTADALSAFWSPMISWTMLPFMAAGMATEEALEFASALWCSIGIAAAMYFVWRWTSRNIVATAGVGLVVFVLCAGNLSSITPDLMVVTWTILFVWILSEVNDHLRDDSRRHRILWGGALGVVLALGYYIKAYAVPVFLVVGLGWLIVRILNERAKTEKGARLAAIRRLLLAPLAGAAVCLILIAPFAVAISLKYDTPTFGTSFAVNTQDKLTGTAKESSGPSLVLPAPPNAYAIYFGYDPTAKLTKTKVELGETAAAPRGAVGELEYYIKQRLIAFPEYLTSLQNTAPFAVPIAALFVVLLTFGFIGVRKHRAAVITAATLIVYFLGYAALTSTTSGGGRDRYHWPLLALSTIIAGLMWPAVWKAAKAGQWSRRALAIVLVALIPLASIQEEAIHEPYPFGSTTSSQPLTALFKSPTKSSAQTFSEMLLAKGIVSPGDRIVGSNGQYTRTLLYGFYLRAQVYGRRIPNDIADPRFQQVLRNNKIQYFFLFRPVDSGQLDVSSWGVVKERYDMPYSCGTASTVSSSARCQLEIVSVNP
jgi:uncharacterized membrane protein